MPTINAVGIISKPRSDLAARLVPELIAWLMARGLAIRLDTETAQYAGRSDGMAREEIAAGAGLVIVLGGDGTLLSAARAVSGTGIPLFAVNLGGLGFLTAITVDEIYPQLERALRGDFRIAHRRMLECELWRGSDRLARYDALNDMVLTKFEIARMIDLEVQIDGHFVCVYRADGLIVATPTGSTAYALSAGGPIIFPTLEVVVLAPICPHTLSNRPVVLPDSCALEVRIDATDHDATLTVDGQEGIALGANDRVLIGRGSSSVALVRSSHSYFEIWRNKLRWG